MYYLFIGQDSSLKDKKIFDLKKQILPTNEALKFDYDGLYGSKLDSKQLKKSLISLPAIAKKRLVVIRDSHKLSPANKEIVFAALKEKLQHLALVLESESWKNSDAYVKKIKSYVQIIQFKQAYQQSVFDITRLIERGDKQESLNILYMLLKSGTHPLQIIGGLVWFWGKSRWKISPDCYKKGLLALQEADLNIKRSRIKADYAVEVLVVKLGIYYNSSPAECC